MEANKIYNEECLETLSRMANESIDLIIASPPTNKGWYRFVMYSESPKDSITPMEYEAWQRRFIKECMRVLKPNGSMYYNHKDNMKFQRLIHPTWVYDFPLHQIIVWDKANTLEKADDNYTPITEYIYWLYKGDYPYFRKENSAYKSNIWDVRMDKNGYSSLPLAMVRSMILSTCPPNGVVYDPFMGGGTTALAVQQLGGGRVYIGSEKKEKLCKIAERRLREDARQLSLF